MSYFKEEDWEDAEDLTRDESEFFATIHYLWVLAEVYELPLTNNSERIQDGVFLRELPEFMHDVMICMLKAGWSPPEGFVEKSSSKKEYEQAINTYRKRREFRDSSG